VDDRHNELRADLIAALMSAEEMDYADAERVVAEFERSCKANLANIQPSESLESVWGLLPIGVE